jgi:hypothetical protein
MPIMLGAITRSCNSLTARYVTFVLVGDEVGSRGRRRPDQTPVRAPPERVACDRLALENSTGAKMFRL